MRRKIEAAYAKSAKKVLLSNSIAAKKLALIIRDEWRDLESLIEAGLSAEDSLLTIQQSNNIVAKHVRVS